MLEVPRVDYKAIVGLELFNMYRTKYYYENTHTRTQARTYTNDRRGRDRQLGRKRGII